MYSCLGKSVPGIHFACYWKAEQQWRKWTALYNNGTDYTKLSKNLKHSHINYFHNICHLWLSPSFISVMPCSCNSYFHSNFPSSWSSIFSLASSSRAAGKARCSTVCTRWASVSSVSPGYTGTDSCVTIAPPSTSSWWHESNTYAWVERELSVWRAWVERERERECVRERERKKEREKERKRKREGYTHKHWCTHKQKETHITHAHKHTHTNTHAHTHMCARTHTQCVFCVCRVHRYWLLCHYSTTVNLFLVTHRKHICMSVERERERDTHTHTHTHRDTHTPAHTWAHIHMHCNTDTLLRLTHTHRHTNTDTYTHTHSTRTGSWLPYRNKVNRAASDSNPSLKSQFQGIGSFKGRKKRWMNIQHLAPPLGHKATCKTIQLFCQYWTFPLHLSHKTTQLFCQYWKCSLHSSHKTTQLFCQYWKCSLHSSHKTTQFFCQYWKCSLHSSHKTTQFFCQYWKCSLHSSHKTMQLFCR